MKLLTARFEFVDHNKRLTLVTFDGDEVFVVRGRHLFTKENKERPYSGRPFKPCLSHCRRLIEMAQEDAERKAVRK